MLDHPWDTSCVDDPFAVLWDLSCQPFVEEFCMCACQDMGLMLLYLVSLSGLGIKGLLVSQDEFRRVPPSFSCLREFEKSQCLVVQFCRTQRPVPGFSF